MSSGWFDYTEPHLHKGIKVCSVPHSFPILKQHEEVRSGSVQLNPPEFVYSYPPHLVPIKTMQLPNLF